MIAICFYFTLKIIFSILGTFNYDLLHYIYSNLWVRNPLERFESYQNYSSAADDHNYIQDHLNVIKDLDTKTTAETICSSYVQWRKTWHWYLSAIVNICYDSLWLIGIIIKELISPSLGVFRMIHTLFNTIKGSFINNFNNAGTLTILSLSVLFVFFVINGILYFKLRKQVHNNQTKLQIALNNLKEII